MSSLTKLTLVCSRTFLGVEISPNLISWHSVSSYSQECCWIIIKHRQEMRNHMVGVFQRLRPASWTRDSWWDVLPKQQSNIDSQIQKCPLPLSGLQSAVRGGALLPAAAHAGRAGALAPGPGAGSGAAPLRVPGGARGPRTGREDHAQRRQGPDRGRVSGDRRRHVQLGQRRLEPRLHARHQVPAQRVLPSQLCPGNPEHQVISEVGLFSANVLRVWLHIVLKSGEIASAA